MRLRLKYPVLVCAGLCALLTAGCETAPKQSSLNEVYSLLKTKEFVDLTHAFEPGIPHWPGFPDETRETLYWYEKGRGTMGDGFFAQRFCHVGQWGTHVDPPVHFAKGMRTLDQIDVKEMVLPLVVIDIHEKVEKDPDYTVAMEDVKGWEARHGPVPQGAFVALRTDWSKRWPDRAAMQNKDAKGVRSRNEFPITYHLTRITHEHRRPSLRAPRLAARSNLMRCVAAGLAHEIASPAHKNGPSRNDSCARDLWQSVSRS